MEEVSTEELRDYLLKYLKYILDVFKAKWMRFVYERNYKSRTIKRLQIIIDI